MTSVGKLIRRFVGILVLSMFLLFVVNVVILLAVASTQTPGIGPWTTAQETEAGLQKTETGYTLSAEMTKMLEDKDAWAVYIDNDTRKVLWHTENLPSEIPMQYTITDISSLTRGYLADYPTYTAGSENGLVVVGFPKDRYWKHMSPSWDYDFIRNSPYIALSAIGINVAVVLLIYVTANTKLLRSVRPIADGIQALPTKAPLYVKEKGLLSDLAKDINRTADILQSQRRDLRKKEAARADWISGVSHDIRTPLSMVMGYAGQLEDAPELSEDDRRKAAIIRQQSVKMKNLVNDLNLASKLEYNMQPLCLEQVNMAAVARQCAADFMNTDISGKYPLEWKAQENLPSCVVRGDKTLLGRALNNLLNNAQTHNPDGCHITMGFQVEEDSCCIAIEDDGVGIPEEKLEKLKNTPHYMMNDSGADEPRHGLGLLIVQQIIKAHHGEVRFSSGANGGLRVEIWLPLSSEKKYYT